MGTAATQELLGELPGNSSSLGKELVSVLSIKCTLQMLRGAIYSVAGLSPDRILREQHKTRSRDKRIAAPQNGCHASISIPATSSPTERVSSHHPHILHFCYHCLDLGQCRTWSAKTQAGPPRSCRTWSGKN